jgi:hypothetical protein
MCKHLPYHSFLVSQVDQSFPDSCFVFLLGYLVLLPLSHLICIHQNIKSYGTAFFSSMEPQASAKYETRWFHLSLHGDENSRVL